jgi:hypothetical protein
MKKWIPLLATLIIVGVCFTWTARSFDDDKPRDGDRDKPREDERERARDSDRDRPAGERAHRERDGQSRELEAWLEQREKQINSLRKHGKIDQAEALAQRTRKELDQHRRAMANRKRGERDEHGKREQDPEVRKFLEQAERKINELRKQGKHEEAEKLLRHVKAEMAERHEHGEGREREHGEREHGEREGGNEARMKHIGAAIEHLQAAGMRDWAEELAAHAREMNKERGHREAREDREEPEHRHERHEHGEDDEGDGVDQLRREVNELRNALREIQKHLEKSR